MNERIRELMEQAMDLVDPYAIEGEFGPRQLNTEKFAELIVTECANILMQPEYAMNHPEELRDYNKGWVNGRLLGIEHIKQHFGVEDER